MDTATENDVVVSLTESAAHQVKVLLADEKENAGKTLRVFVEGGGCSGMQYGMVFDEKREDDFSAFRASGSSQGSPVCRVMRASWTGHGPFLRFDIVADHFLYHMVRNIVGTALKVAAAPDPAAAMDSIVASRDRRRAGVTAPAQGLCLEQVFYPEGLEL